MNKTTDGTKGEVSGRESCPGEEVLQQFAERLLDEAQMEAVVSHLLECSRCRESVKDIAEWLAAGRILDVDDATPDEKRIVEKCIAAVREKHAQTLWRRIFAIAAPSRVYLAAADGQTADQLQRETALKSSFIHFVSCGSEKHKDAWHAMLAVPVEATDETCLRLQVFDKDERPVESGALTFCGVDLPIEDGYAYMPIKTFREHVGVSLIALKTEDGRTIPGMPVRAGAYEGGL